MQMRDVALAAARRGFKVFPLRPREKRPPLILGWQIAATTDEQQIHSWWAQWPEANVGIHCDGLLVVDVDPKKGGYESLETLKKEVTFPATLEVQTPSGGRHIYFRCVSPISNGVDVFGTGLDVRTTAGYVVSPGSRTAAGDYRVVSAGRDIADAPAELVSRMGSGRAERAQQPAPIQTDTDAACQRARDFLLSHPVATEGQGGDHHTFRTICRLRDFGVPEDRALDTLAGWNARCVPPWDEGDLRVKVANAYAYAQNPEGALSPEALGFEVVQPEEASSGGRIYTPPDDVRAKAEPMHPSEVALDEILTADYLIKGVLERQSNAVLFGMWNVGKSFIVLDMAASIAVGLPWFGKRVRQGRVLYLGYEGIRAMKKRMVALREKYPALKDRITPFEWSALRIPLTRPEGVQALGQILVTYAEHHGGPPDLIIIDPLANALGGDDADAAIMGKLNECVAALIQKQRCTVLRVHHSGHGNQERARGHSSLPAGVDTEIRVNDQEIALTKQRDDIKGLLSFKLDVVTLGKDSDGDDVTTCVVTQVEANSMSPDLSGPQRSTLDALIRLRGDGGKVKKTEIRDASPGLDPAQRRQLIDVLTRKQYLRAEGALWVICERGPLAIFD